MLNWIRVLGQRIHGLFSRRRLDEEFQQELDSHLEMLTEENLRRGLSPDEARRMARVQLGGITQLRETNREMWGLPWLETLWQDLRYGLRQLRRNPGFTAVAVLTLALGIGANTAIFSVVEGVLLKPLPYPHPEQLVAVRFDAPGLNANNLPLSASTYFIFREQSRTFQDIGLYTDGSVGVTGLREPTRVRALRVTDGVLPMLGMLPVLGRLFTRTDDLPGSPETVILTYGYWYRTFGGDPSVIGRVVTVDGKPREIIGVLRQRFRFLDLPEPALLLPIKLDRARTYLGGWRYGAVARLKPGVTLAEATSDAERMLPIVMRSFPVHPSSSFNLFQCAGTRPHLRPLRDDVVGDVGKVLWVLAGGIGMVFLIACANVANLLLARVEGRRQELAVRAALGASRGCIARGLLVESFLLALLGGGLGLGLAYGALRLLAAMGPAELPRLHEIGVDVPVLLFTLAVSCLAGVLFGSVPLLNHTRARPGIGLQEIGRSVSPGKGRHRARKAMTIVQVALALVLLISSGLMIRTFDALRRVKPGFTRPEEVQTFRLVIPERAVKDPERVIRMEQDILRRVKAIPGVLSAGISTAVPMAGTNWFDPIIAKGRPYAAGKLPPPRRLNFISPGFFKTIGTPLIAGRDVTWSDIYTQRPVAIVSKRFAREYWHDPLSALGNQIRASDKGDWREIIGVVGNIHEDGANREPSATVYWPILMARFETHPITVQRHVAVAFRSPRVGSEGLSEEVRRAVWSVDPNLPLADVHTLEYFYRKSMARTSFTLVMLALAGGMALLLGMVGLYGVIACSVTRRTHEIGIRMALGAERGDVLKMVVGQGLKLALIGVAIGIGGALALTRFLSSLLYGVKPTDPLTFIAVSLILIAVALLACYIPARRAAKVDPMVALRYE